MCGVLGVFQCLFHLQMGPRMVRCGDMMLRALPNKHDDGYGLTDTPSGMIRPLKKRNGVVAGMPRSGGGRHSPIGSNVADGEGVVRQVFLFPT